MDLRKVTSLTALVSFILEILTSIILYIVPHGRVAYWSDWHLWGLSKTQWANLHINLGILFLIAVVIHTWYNWSIITAYLKNKAHKVNFLTMNFVISMTVSLLFCLGTYLEIPPFSTIIEFSNSIKDAGTRTYGEPPYGHAELSTLKIFCKKTGLDLKESQTKLKVAGINLNGTEQTLAEIAKLNSNTPKDLYEIIRPPEVKSTTKGLPLPTPSGVGRLSLAELCKEYGIDISEVQKVLAEAGFTSTPESSIKDIGSKYSRNPHDIYDLLADKFKRAE